MKQRPFHIRLLMSVVLTIFFINSSFTYANDTKFINSKIIPMEAAMVNNRAVSDYEKIILTLKERTPTAGNVKTLVDILQKGIDKILKEPNGLGLHGTPLFIKLVALLKSWDTVKTISGVADACIRVEERLRTEGGLSIVDGKLKKILPAARARAAQVQPPARAAQVQPPALEEYPQLDDITAGIGQALDYIKNNYTDEDNISEMQVMVIKSLNEDVLLNNLLSDKVSDKEYKYLQLLISNISIHVEMLEKKRMIGFAKKLKMFSKTLLSTLEYYQKVTEAKCRAVQNRKARRVAAVARAEEEAREEKEMREMIEDLMGTGLRDELGIRNDENRKELKKELDALVEAEYISAMDIRVAKGIAAKNRQEKTTHATTVAMRFCEKDCRVAQAQVAVVKISDAALLEGAVGGCEVYEEIDHINMAEVEPVINNLGKKLVSEVRDIFFDKMEKSLKRNSIEANKKKLWEVIVNYNNSFYELIYTWENITELEQKKYEDENVRVCEIKKCSEDAVIVNCVRCVFDAFVKLIEEENQYLLSIHSELKTFSEDEKKSYDKDFETRVKDITSGLEKHLVECTMYTDPRSDFVKFTYNFIQKIFQHAIVDIVQMRAEKLHIRRGTYHIEGNLFNIKKRDHMTIRTKIFGYTWMPIIPKEKVLQNMMWEINSIETDKTKEEYENDMFWENNDSVLVYQLIVQIFDGHFYIPRVNRLIVEDDDGKSVDKFVDYMLYHFDSTGSFRWLEEMRLHDKLRKLYL